MAANAAKSLKAIYSSSASRSPLKSLFLKGAKEEGRVSTGTMLNKKSWEETFESDTE